MPEIYRHLDLIIKEKEPDRLHSWATEFYVPIHLLTISGSAEEEDEIYRSKRDFDRVIRGGYLSSKEFKDPSYEFLLKTFSNLIFAGYLSAKGRGDSYVDWLASEPESLPFQQYRDAFQQCERYANLLMTEPAFPTSGSITAKVEKLAETLKKYKALGFFLLILGGSEALGNPLSPFGVIEVAIEGVSCYFILAVGTAATDRMVAYIKTVGKNPEKRRR